MLFSSILKFWQYFISFFELFCSNFISATNHKFFFLWKCWLAFFSFLNRFFLSSQNSNIFRFKSTLWLCLILWNSLLAGILTKFSLNYRLGKFWLEKEVENWRVTWKGYLDFRATNNLEEDEQNLIWCIYLSLGDVYLTGLLCSFM